MNQELKQIVLNNSSGSSILCGLQGGFLALSDLDSRKHVGSAVEFCLENGKKIPQRFMAQTSDYLLKQNIFGDRSSQSTESLAYEQFYQEFVRRLNCGMVIDPDDIKWPLGPKVANAISHLVVKTPDNCVYTHWRNKREFFPQEIWKNILSERRLGIKPHKAKKYSCLLEEGIMKNNYSMIAEAHKRPSDISRQEWDAWKEDWFQTEPRVKVFILQTPFFSSLSQEEQQKVLADVSPALCDFSFIKDMLLGNCRIPRPLLEKLPLEVTYNLILLEMHCDEGVVIDPSYSHHELTQCLTPLIITHPEKVTSMLQAYKIREVVQEQIEKRKSTSPSGTLSSDPDVYFATSTIKQYNWKWMHDSDSLRALWKIYRIIESCFTEAQKEVALSAFADLKNRYEINDYAL